MGLPQDIAELMAADKTLGSTPRWDVKSDSRYASLLHPLSVAGMTVGGFDLRVKISKQFIARDATAQLEFSPSGRRSATPLWRIEWKPFTQHPNGKYPPDFAFQTLTGSHEHTFDDNFVTDEVRMRSPNLPAARPTSMDPNTLSDFLAFCGGRFRIVDISRVRIPALGGDLLWT